MPGGKRQFRAVDIDAGDCETVAAQIAKAVETAFQQRPLRQDQKVAGRRSRITAEPVGIGFLKPWQSRLQRCRLEQIDRIRA